MGRGRRGPAARLCQVGCQHAQHGFIGEVDGNVAHDIDDALAGIRAPSFTLELAGVGEFGGKNPRALWAGVRPNDAILILSGEQISKSDLKALGADGAVLKPFDIRELIAQLRSFAPAEQTA